VLGVKPESRRSKEEPAIMTRPTDGYFIPPRRSQMKSARKALPTLAARVDGGFVIS
jgi:hypothetical protein